MVLNINIIFEIIYALYTRHIIYLGTFWLLHVCGVDIVHIYNSSESVDILVKFICKYENSRYWPVLYIIFATILKLFIEFLGVEEAISAGTTLRQRCYQFDVAHTSVLTRAKDTLSTILNQLDQTNIPVHTNWRLNERHYGGLTGLNKSETAKQYGEDKVYSFNVRQSCY